VAISEEKGNRIVGRERKGERREKKGNVKKVALGERVRGGYPLCIYSTFPRDIALYYMCIIIIISQPYSASIFPFVSPLAHYFLLSNSLSLTLS
jgi:hypothetical protein